jgi:DNA repair protein RecO (recombination protein O)
MDEKAEGIILRTRPLTETSLIVEWLTREFGRISTVAKGARRAKSPFAGKLDLYYEAAFTFQRSRRSQLHWLKEVRLRELHPKLRTDLYWLSQSAYASQLLELLTETDTPLPEIFELWRSYITALPFSAPNRAAPIAFEFKLFDSLGLGPNLANASPLAQQTVGTLIGKTWDAAAQVNITQPLFIELNRISLMTLSQFTQKIPASRAKALMMR